MMQPYPRKGKIYFMKMKAHLVKDILVMRL